MPSDSRDKMINATIELLRERGYAGTSFGDVVARSGAPRGSIYHHFPGGKQHLVSEAVTRYATAMAGRLRRAVESGPALDAVAVLLASVRDGLRASDFSLGCAIAAVVLDVTPTETGLLDLTAKAFADWRAPLARAFAASGADAATAQRLATFVVSAVEGALILARAERSLAPIDDVGAELTAFIHSALST